MTSNDFRLLGEIKVHLGEILSLKEAIRAEESRISSIKKQIENREVCLHDLKESRDSIHKIIATKETELFELEKKIETSQKHESMAHNQKEAEALEHEGKTLGDSANTLQESLLELMEEEETLSSDIEKAETFIKGSLESLNEVTDEVKKKIDELNTEIADHEKEWKDHARSLSDSNKAVFKNSYQKFKDSMPFSDLKGQCCKRCGYGLDSMLHRTVLSQTTLEICPGCNRILLI